MTVKPHGHGHAHAANGGVIELLAETRQIVLATQGHQLPSVCRGQLSAPAMLWVQAGLVLSTPSACRVWLSAPAMLGLQGSQGHQLSSVHRRQVHVCTHPQKMSSLPWLRRQECTMSRADPDASKASTKLSCSPQSQTLACCRAAM